MLRTKKFSWLLTAMLVAMLTMASVVPAYAADGDEVSPPDTAAETSSTDESSSPSDTDETTETGDTDSTSEESLSEGTDDSTTSDETGETTDDSVSQTDETTSTDEELIPSASETETTEEEVTPVEESTQETEQPVVETADEVVQEVVEDLDEMDLTLTDENGEVLSMASDETAEALASGDPTTDGVSFKNGTTTFYFYKDADVCPAGSVTCFDDLDSTSNGPIYTALFYIKIGYVYSGTKKITSPSDGVIRVLENSAGADYADTIVIDSTYGVKQLVGAGSNLVTLTGSVTIINHFSGFTLSGFTITPSDDVPAVLVQNTSGSITLNDLVIDTSAGSSDGVKVNNHGGTLTIKKVSVRNSGGNGINIDNAIGTGTISISNSSADTSIGTGILINARGSVNISGTSASGNGGYGTSIIAKGLTVKNSVFNDNTGNDGLYFESYSTDGTAAKAIQGSVSLSNVLANNNAGNGVYVMDYGTITLSQVRASGNGSNGAYLNNCNTSGSVCGYTTPYGISITDSAFNGNAQTTDGAIGLEAYSGAGISLSDVDADNNGDSGGGVGGQGIVLYNKYQNLVNLVYTWNPKAISLSNVSASGNYGNGLTLTTFGSVTLKNANMSNNGNGGYGASIENDFDTTLRPAVTLSNTSGSWNIFDNNENTGILIDTLGAVNMSYVQAGGNTDDGVNIDNRSNALDGTGGNAITLNYGNFVGNGGDGIDVLTYGNINLKLGTYDVSNNTGHGVNLNNAGAATAKTVTITGGVFENNTDSAVYVISKGNVSIKDTEANDNSDYGFEIDNTTGVGASVTLTSLTATGNTGYGFYVTSDGTITASYLDANQNGNSGTSVVGNGAYFYNKDAETAKSVSIKNSHFDENFGYGVRVDSKGSITFTSSYADTNTRAAGDAALAYGAWLNNAFAPTLTPTTVTVSSSYFRDNLGKGLEVDSKGAISVKSSTAEDNNRGGFDLDNKQTSGPSDQGTGNITLSGLKVYDNYVFGLQVFSAGNITASSLDVTGNGDNTVPQQGNGAYFNNTTTGESISRTVSISSSHFDENFGYGLRVLSYGAISLSSVYADENTYSTAADGYGAYLQNTGAALSDPGITISSGSFDSNSGKGITALSRGSIKFTSSGAEKNGNDGVTLNNAYDPNILGASYSITVSGVSSRSYLGLNNGDGLLVTSWGTISVSNIKASDNVGFGAILDNSGTDASFPKSISISSCYFDNNDDPASAGTGEDGLKATSLGSISLKYSDARNNSGNGALLDNSASGSSAGISIVNTSSNYGYYSSNDGNGLEALTTGSMSVSYVEAASNNGTYGVTLDNSGGSAPHTVSITAVRTLTNAGDGMNINAYGPVTMSSLRAIQNVGNGVTVSNGGIGIDNIILGGSSIFSNNGGYGINAYSSKAITMSGILAESNTGDGIIAYSDNSDGIGVVTIKSSRAYSNGANGITATSGGDLILSNVISLANAGDGANLMLSMTDDGYDIYVTDSAFHNNTGAGLNLNKEAASLSGTTYYGNAGGNLIEP